MIRCSLWIRIGVHDGAELVFTINRIRTTHKMKILSPEEYLEEMLKDGACRTMNECQCLGIKGGCPGKPGWTPEDLFEKKEVNNNEPVEEDDNCE